MFKTLTETFKQDRDLPERAFRLQMRSRVIDGTIYDNLPSPFHEEKNNAGEYVPLRNRRPCVRYRLCRLVVDDSVSLLFSEGHFPDIDCEDETAKEALNRLIDEMEINRVFIEAATVGSVGSVVVILRILKNRPFLSAMPSQFLTPIYDPNAPDTLIRVEERYKALGRDLKDAGYTIADDDLAAEFWFARDFTTDEETWFQPLKVVDRKEGKQFVRDDAKSVIHGLGFVPVLWIKNLPGGDDIDGEPTFPNEAIETGIEIDYQLSQAGRALKYSADPTLLIKEPAFSGDRMVRSAGNAIVVDAEGDAKMLEINGTASAAVIEYVRFLRELALETMHGNRANAEKETAAPSGRALEMMNQALIWLADKLRISYGENGILAVVRMLVRAHAKLNLKFKDGSAVPAIADSTEVSLRWPEWYPPTLDDLQTRATTLISLTDGGLLSRETAIKILAAEYDIEDAKAELALADADMAKRNAEAQKQIKLTE